MRLPAAILGLFFLSSVAFADEPLARKIEAVIDGKDYKQARWGICVIDAQTGKAVYERDPEKLIIPASVTKLYSCSAAMIAFGADHKFVTPVYARGDVSDKGVLKGDLILVASGDLSFGGRTTKGGKLAFVDHDHSYANGGLYDAELTETSPLAALEDLAKQVKAAGIQEITGEVLIDDRLFDSARGTGSGPGAISPIVLNDNMLDIIVKPGAKPGDRASVTIRPATAAIAMDAEVTTGEPGSATSIILNTTGATQFTVRGKIAAKERTHIRSYPVDEPAWFARAVFIETLRKEGIRVQAGLARAARTDFPRHGYAELQKVGEYSSPPLSEVLKVTLKVSHNLYASTLPCLLAAKVEKRTLGEGLQEQRKILKKLGVPVETISFAGGAGGAAADAVTPKATVLLLQSMMRRDDWPKFRECLPSLGVDGTLAEVVPAGSPARGKVFAKTGTLVWGDSLNGRSLLKSKALAGVMTTKGGRELIVAMFVNDAPLPAGAGPAREGKVLGKLCEILYEGGK